MAKPYYITSAIPYVNAKPHIGHAQEWFQADTLARYHRLLGFDVAFTCGTDENSLKNVQAAEKKGVSTQEWLDTYADIFRQTFEKLNISLTSFQRGSDQTLHWPGVQALWQRCVEAGDIYTKQYSGLYCVGCEAYYTPEELVDGLCPDHLVAPELVEEENYFFRLSKYQDQLASLLETDEVKIIDHKYKSEMLSFIHQGLEDFSVSRSQQRARGIGVPVPDDTSQVLYVWFDALAIYLTAVGWNIDIANFEKYWPADTHVIGKGIARFHAIYFLAILLSAHLPLPKTIHVHGYATVEGQKMSKSLGNVLDPLELIEEYGLEPVRYYLLRGIPTFSDGDFSLERFKVMYNADLANGLGNVCSRIAALAAQDGLGSPDIESPKNNTVPTFNLAFSALMESHSIDAALDWIWDQIAQTDKWLSSTKPWTLPSSERRDLLTEGIQRVRSIATHLQPFMPSTAELIFEHYSQTVLSKLPALFPRI